MYYVERWQIQSQHTHKLASDYHTHIGGRGRDDIQ